MTITVFSCSTKKGKLSIEFNPNIATYSIVERLVANHNGRLFYIDGKRDYDYIPMVQKAFNEFKRKDNSKIIESTLNYLSIVGNQQDLTYQSLIRSEKFPENGFKYSLEGLNADTKKLEAVEQYIEDLKEFYLENNLNEFFQNNMDFINGGINEFKKNVPDSYVEQMEKYYGQSFEKFVVYPDAFNTVPMDSADTDFFHGNGQQIETKSNSIATMITSPFLPIDVNKQTTEYGFNHPDYIKLIITHEFGHSFVNHTLQRVQPQLNETENLFYSGLFEKMQSQGYGNWFTCMAEHLVRLGEIRIAETKGEKQRAKELRDMHINEFSFVLIPILETKIIEYEQNRDKYPSYEDFLPDLLSILKVTNPAEVRELLSLSTETFSTTINITVPNREDEVFIVGNQTALGNWSPNVVKMNKTADFVRSIKLNLYSDAKLKFTKGSWATEGKLEKLDSGQNVELKINNDSIYNFKIREWKK